MNKYYVESGDIKEVIHAPSDREACIALLKKHMSPGLKISESFVVSQKGFVYDREPFEINTSESIFSSMDIIKESNESYE